MSTFSAKFQENVFVRLNNRKTWGVFVILQLRDERERERERERTSKEEGESCLKGIEKRAHGNG